jgi:alanine racemase
MTERAAWVEIDAGALRYNLRLVQQQAGKARVYAVCKGHAYGFGAVMIARAAEAEGLWGVAVGDPADALAIRSAGVRSPILIYASTEAAALPGLARLDVIVTVHDLASLGACLQSRQRFSIKLDCGFGRLGFREDEIGDVIEAIRRADHSLLHGLYAHMADTEDDASIARQVGKFKAMADGFEAAGIRPLEKMIASSRVLIAHPELCMDAINPGRLIYGVLEPQWTGRLAVQPVLAAVKARLIAVKRFQAGQRVGYSREPLSADAVLGVIPYGFADGYPRTPAGGSVLIRGSRVPLVGMRHTEHSIVDLSSLSNVAPGEEVVLLGRQGNDSISLDELVRVTGITDLELVSRLARGPNRRMINDR